MPSHTDNATLVLEVQPADRRPPWFLPCIYSDNYVCVHAEYHGAIPTGHKLVLGTGRAGPRPELDQGQGQGLPASGVGPGCHAASSVVIFKQMCEHSLVIQSCSTTVVVSSQQTPLRLE